MNRTVIVEQLKNYIAQDVLGGKDIGLDETTPLLAWGLINSLEMVKLLRFIRQCFKVDISTDKLSADFFTDIASITNLILEQMPSQS
ncbi:MAG: acyl carrier protein [Chloroflexi bacterium]|nr:MAG: acyl carrier protein [Chloroflexota bacterium]